MGENLERNINLTEWIDGETPVNAEHLNAIKNKIISNSGDINTISQAIVGLQPKNDNSLETTNKNVPSAINELKREKFDKVSISGNILKFYANNVEKFSITLPENQETDLTEINNSLATKYDNVTLEGQNLKFYVGSTLKKTITLPVGEGGSVDLSGYQTTRDETLTTTDKTVVGAINEVASDTSQKANKNNIFLKRLLKGDIKKIKLIGDSITSGAQCKGYNVPPDGRIILQNSRFNDGGTGYARETGTDWNTFPSWPNLFRKYIKTVYPTIDFFNAGIGGLSLSETITYIKKPENSLIEDDDDVIFLMLGTNDRRLDYTEFKSNLDWLVNFLKTRCNTLILMSTPPTISEYGGTGKEYDTWVYDGAYLEEYKFGCREINMCYQEMADKYSLTFINNNVKSSEYMVKTNSAFYDINSDRTHPNTLGHKVIWNNIQEELGLIGQLSDFIGDGITKSNMVPFQDFQKFSKLPVGVSLTTMLSGEGQGIGLPRAGTVLSIKPTDQTGLELLTAQYYIEWGNAKIKYRAYKGDGSSDLWTDWTDLSSSSSGISESGVYYSSEYILQGSDLSTLKQGITIGYISNSEGSTNNFPLLKGGMVITYKPHKGNDGYTHQIFFPYGINRQYVRSYVDSTSFWGSWATDKVVTMAQSAYLVTMSTLLTDNKFEEGINYHYMVASEPDVPESKAGTLITHKPPTALLGYGYQEYHTYGFTTIHKRVWKGSIWGEWVKITP